MLGTKTCPAGNVHHMRKPKILYLVTEDWYFWTHRFSLALAAVAAGYEVVLVTNVGKYRDPISQAGIRVIPLQYMRRSSVNIFRELLSLWEVIRIILAERPRLVHLVALKPVIYGSIAAKICRKTSVVCALGGLGYLVSATDSKSQIIKSVVLWMSRFIFNGRSTKLILQNDDDVRIIAGRGAVDPSKIVLIRGAGVDLIRYKPKAMPSGLPIAMLASRMLWDKGVGEFVHAAKLLHSKGISARFVLVGEPDSENPSSIPRQQLAEWNEHGVVEWWGHQDDMPEALAQASIVCLPSYYGEGVPKVLLESMACGRPIVTTDMPGCRDLVHSGHNGVLVQPRDAAGLADALERLLRDLPACGAMGREGRKIAEASYGLDGVVAQTLGIYSEMIRVCPP